MYHIFWGEKPLIWGNSVRISCDSCSTGYSDDPEQCFRRKPDSDSVSSRTPIPMKADKNRSEATQVWQSSQKVLIKSIWIVFFSWSLLWAPVYRHCERADRGWHPPEWDRQWFRANVWPAADLWLALNAAHAGLQGFPENRASYGVKAWWTRKKSQNRHAGLDPASRTYWNHWIPAFAGMTKKVNSRLFTRSSSLNCE